MKTQQNDNKAILMRLLDISEQEYETKVFETAYQYLDSVLNCDETGKKLLTHNRLFWIWWTNQWDRRNRILVHDLSLSEINWIITPDALQCLRKEYAFRHSVAEMNIRPNRIVMENSYAAMIGGLIDEQLKTKKA